MKLGQFLDKVSVYSEVERVSIWVKCKEPHVGSPTGYVWKNYNVVRNAGRYDDEVKEYRDYTLEGCYIENGHLEFELKDKPQK